MEEQTLHFTLGENAGKLVVDIARELAYQTKTYNDGITFLFASGIEDYALCRQLLAGEKTLAVDTDKEGYQIFVPIEDDWQPPVKDEEKMKKETIKYCNFIISNAEPYAGRYAYKIVRSEQEIATLIARAHQILEVVEVAPKVAYKQMLRFNEEMKNETNRRAIDRNETVKQIRATSEAEVVTTTSISQRAKKHLERCDDEECKYCKMGKCIFALREKLGCIVETPEAKEYIDQLSMLAVTEICRHDNKYFKYKADKQFEFTFKEHKYTYYDSARDQSRCPHCNQQTNALRMIDPIKDIDKFEFIGFKQLSDDECAVCFECLECGNKLFYHQDLIFTQQQLDIEYPELKEKFYGL